MRKYLIVVLLLALAKVLYSTEIDFMGDFLFIAEPTATNHPATMHYVNTVASGFVPGSTVDLGGGTLTNGSALHSTNVIAQVITLGGVSITNWTSGVDTTFTNWISGDTEIVVAGGPRSGSNTLSIGSGIARTSVTNGLAPTNWVTALGYGTGDLVKAVADTLYDAYGSAATVSNWVAGLGYATNAGAGGSDLWCQSNGAWVVFTPGTGGGGTGDLLKSVADTLYAGIGVTNNPLTEALTNGLWNRDEGTNWVTALGYGTGDLARVVADALYDAYGSSTVVSNWVVARNYGTGNLAQAVANLAYAPISVTIPAASNAALAGISAGLAMTGPLSLSNPNLNGGDEPPIGFGGPWDYYPEGGVHWNYAGGRFGLFGNSDDASFPSWGKYLYLIGPGVASYDCPYLHMGSNTMELGRSYGGYFQPNLIISNGAVQISSNLVVVGTITEDGTALGSKYAPISVTIPAASNAAMAGATATFAPISTAVTNAGCTINGQSVANGAALTISGTGAVSAADCTNIFSALSASTYWTTNTSVVTNSLDFAITGLAANRIALDKVKMYLSTSTNAPVSTRAVLGLYCNSTRTGDDMSFYDTNQLYYSVMSTADDVAGAVTSVVADASGIVIPDLYYKSIGTTSAWQRASNSSATVITWLGSDTNKSNMASNTLISHVNQFGGFNYCDDTGASSMWFRLSFTTAFTGEVQTIIKYGR